MPDLHQRLLAELDWREAIAKAASPGPWVWSRLDPSPSVKLSLVDADRFPVVKTAQSDVWPSASDADYIALHNPADALRRYAHYRRVLERHAPHAFSKTAPPFCGECDGGLGDWPCAELRDLADALGVSVDGVAS